MHPSLGLGSPLWRLPRVKSSAEWVGYFRRNAQRQRPIPWLRGLACPPEQLAEIVASLRSWQLGETSDGAHLRAAAAAYARREQDPDFVDAVNLFIAEEQRHGENLGMILDLAGVSRAQSDWGDRLFRTLRYFLPNMETWVTPVVMVEVHALVYYNAMRLATESELVRTVCTQILADEVAHIRFQCERLAILQRSRPRWLRITTLALHRCLFTAITVAVWFGHRRALKAGGYGFPRFWRSAWARMVHAWRLMAPTEYLWDSLAD